MTDREQRERDKRFLERVRRAEAQEKRDREGQEALDSFARFIIGLILAPFRWFFDFLIYLSTDIVEKNPKKAIIFALSLVVVMVLLIGLATYISIGFCVIFLLISCVMCILCPFIIIEKLGFLKGIAITLIFWLAFLIANIGAMIIGNAMTQILDKQEVAQKPTKLIIKGDFINLRQSPNGNVIAKIYKKDSGKFAIKILNLDNKEWVKVLYLPPNVKDENKAIIGYLHSSHFTNW